MAPGTKVSRQRSPDRSWGREVAVLFAAGRKIRYSATMFVFRARVEHGRLRLDDPTTLRDGEVVELVAVDQLLAAGGDCLDVDERQELHASLDQAEADVDAGRTFSEDEVWNILRAIR